MNITKTLLGSIIVCTIVLFSYVLVSSFKESAKTQKTTEKTTLVGSYNANRAISLSNNKN